MSDVSSPEAASYDPTPTSVMHRLKAGDETAWFELIQAYQDRMLSYLYRLEGNYEDALDLAQEVFFRAWKGIHTFRDGENFLPWLYSIARNTQIEKHRRKQHPQFSLDEAGESGFEVTSHHESPQRAAERTQEADRVQQALLTLPSDYREAIVLRFVEELSYEEIAQVQGVAVGTAKSRVFRGKEMLAQALRGRIDG
ncbi:RNA polymerase sigma-70 factor (ECF subfamily) [Deinobacterium chartae]|uniref:RNA polymerase sigma-70 factor (ECF subfamily) n=1 Tax=Deinobacterium chartae TaxID=521158 RepID=A0A841I3K6_9DEIO|nr:sigma-70 family RNA polymerase sigma factor [Deinobacterium chartae]MBB6098958.1 RNA polymerase sigma-70 factor (ECF subfamily) [Deinobacterium chartae]